MEQLSRKEIWASGKAYEPYVGRWSRLVAREFLGWLEIPASKRWLDVGCGTGALTQTILERSSPAEVKALDRSAGFVLYAREQTKDNRASFINGDAGALPFETGSFDVAISGLVLNFVPVPARMIEEMARVVQPGGTVAVYVWDYAGEMQLMRYFWEAAAALNTAARDFNEGLRFSLCKPEPLTRLFEQSGLKQVEVRPVDIPTHFKNFDDFWTPFLGGQGPAPSYTMSLIEEKRDELREYLRSHLPVQADGSIPLMARAWAVKGKKAGSFSTPNLPS